MQLRTARRIVLAALIVGIAVDLLFDRVALGVNLPIAVGALVVLATLLRADGTRIDRADGWLPVVAMLAATIPALRTDPTVVVLDTLLALLAAGAWALACGGTAVTRRSTAAVAGLGIWLFVSLGIGGYVALGTATADHETGRVRARLQRHTPILRGLVIAVPVVAAFTVLLASADAVFGGFLGNLLTLPIDLGEAVRRALIIVVIAWAACGPLVLAAGWLGTRDRDGRGRPGSSDANQSWGRAAAPLPLSAPHPSGPSGPAPGLALRRGPGTESLVVLVGVDLLFAVFVALQLMYLFGGADTRAAVGITYSDYARQGYFQLVAVVALAGALLLVTAATAARTRGFVMAAVALLVLTAVILASAGLRLRLYQEAYGWTELRFYVAVSIGWLAVCGAAAIILLWRDRMRWLPHALAMSAVAITLAVSALGPQAFVVEQNIARTLDPSLVAAGGFSGFDVGYAVTLGDDAVPELVVVLDRLPEQDRLVLRRVLAQRRHALLSDPSTAGWPAWNLSRVRALDALEALPSPG